MPEKTFFAFLRGINVGGHKRVPMADLRALLGRLGFGDVKTLLQSGNAAFTASGSAQALEVRVSKEIEETFGFEVDVLVRTRAEVQGLVDANPLPHATADGSRLLVALLREALTPDATRLLESLAGEGEFAIGDRALYVWCPAGVLESKVAAALVDRKLKVVMTTRNWNTLTKVLAL